MQRAFVATIGLLTVTALAAAPLATAEDGSEVDFVAYIAGTDGVAGELGDQGPSTVVCRPFGDIGNFFLVPRIPECVGGARYQLPLTDCDGRDCEPSQPNTFGVVINDNRRALNEDILPGAVNEAVHSDVAGTVYVLDGAGLILGQKSFCGHSGSLVLPANATEIVVTIDGPESLNAEKAAGNLLDSTDLVHDDGNSTLPHLHIPPTLEEPRNVVHSCSLGTKGVIALSVTE